jgi:PAS domain S-box-containing protein
MSRTKKPSPNQMERLVQLNALGVALNQAATLDQVLEIGSARTYALLAADRVDINLLRDDGQARPAPGATQPALSETSTGQASREQRVVISPDLRDSQFVDLRQLSEAGLGSAITVPLLGRDRTLGTLNVASRDRAAFGPAEVAVLQQIALLLASAIENQRLWQGAAERTAALEASTHFLDSVIENIPNMIFVKDAAELRFVRFNKAGEELLGFEKAALMGKNDYDFFPKDEADFFIAKDREVLATGQLLDIPEEPIQTAHQGIRTLHTRKVPILGPDGQPRYLLGISEDITERKQNEQALKQSLAETEGLYRVLQAITRSRDQQAVAELALQEYLKLLNLPQGGVLIFDADLRLGTLVALVQAGQPAQAGLRIPVQGNPATEQLIQTRQPVSISDAQTSPLLAPLQDLVDELGYRSMLMAPIIAQGQVIGALGADSVETIHAFTPREIELAQTVANLLGVYFENQDLLERAEQRARRERLLREVTTQVRRSADVETIMRTAAQQVGQALARQAFIYLGNGESDQTAGPAGAPEEA